MKAYVKWITKLSLSLKRTGLYPKASLIKWETFLTPVHWSLMFPGPEASRTSTGRAGSAPWSLPGAQFSTSLAGLSQLHSTRCLPLVFLVSKCLFVSLVVADSMQCSILTFHVNLNVQLTSEGPASSNGSSDLLTQLYHEYIQPHSSDLEDKISSFKFQVPAPSTKSCFSTLSALAIIFITLLYGPFCSGRRNHSVWRKNISPDKWVQPFSFCPLGSISFLQGPPQFNASTAWGPWELKQNEITTLANPI